VKVLKLGFGRLGGRGAARRRRERALHFPRQRRQTSLHGRQLGDIELPKRRRRGRLVGRAAGRAKQ
jgi:hypothetical protein